MTVFFGDPYQLPANPETQRLGHTTILSVFHPGSYGYGMYQGRNAIPFVYLNMQYRMIPAI